MTNRRTPQTPADQKSQVYSFRMHRLKDAVYMDQLATWLADGIQLRDVICYAIDNINGRDIRPRTMLVDRAQMEAMNQALADIAERIDNIQIAPAPTQLSKRLSTPAVPKAAQQALARALSTPVVELDED